MGIVDIEKGFLALKELQDEVVRLRTENEKLRASDTVLRSSFGVNRGKLMKMEEIAKVIGESDKYCEKLMRENPVEFMRRLVQITEDQSDITVRQILDLHVGLRGDTVFKRFKVFRDQYASKDTPKTIREAIQATHDMERLWALTERAVLITSASRDGLVLALDYAIESKNLTVEFRKAEVKTALTVSVSGEETVVAPKAEGKEAPPGAEEAETGAEEG